MDKIQKPVLSQNIIRLRKALGWTAEELSRRSGVAVSSVRDIERGASEGRLETRKLIAQALGCSPEALYAHPPAAPVNVRLTDLDPGLDAAALSMGSAILGALSGLSPSRRKIVWAYIFEDLDLVRREISRESAQALSLLLRTVE